jgi:hypothetical protein
MAAPIKVREQKSGFAKERQIIKGKMVAPIMACTLLAKWFTNSVGR